MAHFQASMITCPYNPAHRIDKLRISKHIIKCRRNHTNVPMETCPFNATHVIPAHQFKAHLLDCEDNTVVLKSLVKRELENEQSSSDSEYYQEAEDDADDAVRQATTGLSAVIESPVALEEWHIPAGAVASHQRAYDPRLSALLKPFVRQVPSGLGKTMRKMWWKMEQKRVRELTEGLPFSPEVRAFLNIPEHLNQDMPYCLEPSRAVPSSSAASSVQDMARLGSQPLRRPRISNPTQPPSGALQQRLPQQQQKQQLIQQQQPQKLIQQQPQKLIQQQPQKLIQQQPPKRVQQPQLQYQQKLLQQEESQKGDVVDDQQHKQLKLQQELESIIKKFKNLQSENETLRVRVQQLAPSKESEKENVCATIAPEETDPKSLNNCIKKFSKNSDSNNTISSDAKTAEWILVGGNKKTAEQDGELENAINSVTGKRSISDCFLPHRNAAENHSNNIKNGGVGGHQPTTVLRGVGRGIIGVMNGGGDCEATVVSRGGGVGRGLVQAGEQ